MAILTGFPRKNRLTRPEEFRRVFERGRHRRIQATGLFLRVREGMQPHPRLGLAISKRVSKRAVDRNRIKRLARESFRQHMAGLPAVDIVLMAQAELVSMNNAVILQQLDVLWERLCGLYPATGVLAKHQTPPTDPMD